MISLSFINNDNEILLASDPFLSLERAMEKMSEEVDNIISGFLNINEEYMIESEIMGEIDHEKTVYLEAEKTNVFEKIGNVVISIFKKFQDLVKKVIDSIKNIGFKSKSNEEKMEKLLSEYKKNAPEKYKTIKDDVVVAFQSGELDPTDMKSIKEMSQAYDELVKLAKQKDVKPDTLRGKFEAMKKKFDDIDSSKVVKGAKATKTIITAIIAIATFRSEIIKSRKNILDCEKRFAEDNDEIIKTIKFLETIEDGKYVSDSLTKAQILKNAHLYRRGYYTKLISKENGKIEKFNKGITSWIARHEKNKRDEFMSGVEKSSKIISEKDKKARDAEREKNKQDSYDKAVGQREANDDAILNKDSNKHRKAVKAEARLKAQAQTRAQRYENDKAHRDSIEDQAELKARGGEKGTPQRKPGVQKIEIVDPKNKKNP